MNRRQKDFITILEKHYSREISFEEIDLWMTQNIKPIINPKTGGWDIPGLILERDAVRYIGSNIKYIQDFKLSPNAELKDYWTAIREFIDFLKGSKIYRKSYRHTESPIGDKWRRYDEWMYPHIQHVEKTFQELQNINGKPLDLGKLSDSSPVLGQRSLSEQTATEIMMREMLGIIEDLRLELSDEEESDTISQGTSQSHHRLEKLIQCFKGELEYSLSVTFEGLDRFSIVIVV